MRKKNARLLDCTTASFQTLMSIFYTEHIQRAQKVNNLLKNMEKNYNMEGTLPRIRPQNMKSIQALVYKQVEHISNQIGYAYCQFNTIVAQEILENLPNMPQVLRVQKWFRKLLDMKRYVKKFRWLLSPADAQALSKLTLYKFGRQANGIQNEDTTSLPARRIQNEDTTSLPATPRKAKVLKSYAPTVHKLFDTICDQSNIIWKELEKRRDERDYRRNLYRNFWRNFLKYRKRIVAVVALGLLIGICVALYEFYRVWRKLNAPEVCGVNDALISASALCCTIR